MDQMLKISHGEGIHTSKGFVEKKVARAPGTNSQGPSDFRAATFATRELKSFAMNKASQVKLSDQTLQAIEKLMRGCRGNLKGQTQIFSHGEVAKNTGLLRQVTNP